MTDIERDLDFIILKTQQLFTLVKQEEYHLLETKELVRKQLIEQFFLNYSPDEIAVIGDKFQQLVNLSNEVTKQCEEDFNQTKQDILKLKQVDKIRKAYK